MNIHIISSKSFYDRFPSKKLALEKMGHKVTLPHTADAPDIEVEAWNNGVEAHARLVRECFEDRENKIAKADAVYLLNLKKHGVNGYVGGATLIELYIAYRNGKKIFLENDAPKGSMYDEIMGFMPTVIHGDLTKIK